MKKLLSGIVLVLLSTVLSMPSLAQNADRYILGAGDKIEIRVFGEEDLSISSYLGNSGKINYPFLGELKVAGLTVKDVEKVIAKGLQDGYLVNPNVFVSVAEHRPFYIHGEVNQPGGYAYQPGLTVNKAIALAGGLTERASKDKISMFREGNKSDELKAYLDDPVRAGDTITIKQRFF